jgi:integrase
VREYMDSWFATARPRLAPRTAENYGAVVRLHVVPYLGDLPLGDLTPAVIRHWHATLLEVPVGATTVAKTYRVLRAAMNTAVEDELIVRNPCVLKGAGVEKSVERPVASIDQVFALADAVEHRFRALVLLAAFACLRQSELFALTRRSLDLEAGVLRVTAAAHDLRNGQRVVRQPKTAAGVRTIAIPAAIRDDLQAHLDLYVDASPDNLLFTGEKGAPLRATTGRRSGDTRSVAPGWTGSASTTCGTPATRSLPRRAPAPAS